MPFPTALLWKERRRRKREKIIVSWARGPVSTCRDRPILSTLSPLPCPLSVASVLELFAFNLWTKGEGFRQCLLLDASRTVTRVAADAAAETASVGHFQSGYSQSTPVSSSTSTLKPIHPVIVSRSAEPKTHEGGGSLFSHLLHPTDPPTVLSSLPCDVRGRDFLGHGVGEGGMEGGYFASELLWRRVLPLSVGGQTCESHQARDSECHLQSPQPDKQHSYTRSRCALQPPLQIRSSLAAAPGRPASSLLRRRQADILGSAHVAQYSAMMLCWTTAVRPHTTGRPHHPSLAACRRFRHSPCLEGQGQGRRFF